MRTEYQAVSYELLRPAQVRALRDKTPIAYVPFGSLEWHGFQNPLGCDSLKAHAICCEAAIKHGGVVLPPFYQGLLGYNNWGAPDWEGFTLSFNEEPTLQAVMLGITRSLVYGGWKVIVGITGHDVAPQRDAMQRAIDTGVEGRQATGFAMMEGELHTATQDIPYVMDHAGAWETSCMMYAYGDRVDLDTLKDKPSRELEDWSMAGPEGIGGKNPLVHASAELGAKIVKQMGDLIGAKARAELDELLKSGESA